MSFLVDAAEMATLEETLAFIDACDGGSLAPTAIATNPVPTARVSTAQAPARCATPQQRRQEKDHRLDIKKPTHVKATTSASTARHRRINSEIVALRNEAAELERQLEQLHALKHVSPDFRVLVTDMENASATSTNQEKWPLAQLTDETRPLSCAEHVVVQYRQRLQSEKTNRELKTIMANQRKLNGSLQVLLQKPSVLKGMDFVAANPLRLSRKMLHADVGVAQLALLEQRVESLYRIADSTLRFEQVPSLSARTMIKHDQQRGKTVEITTTTPLECPMRDATEVVWSEFNNWMPETHSNRLARSYSMVLNGLDFRKSNFVRKFEESERTVIVWADLMLLPQYEIQFRNETWVVITPSATDPHSACVVHIFSQIYLDGPGGSTTCGKGGVPALDAAFAALGNMYRKYLQSQQDELLEELDRRRPSCQQQSG